MICQACLSTGFIRVRAAKMGGNGSVDQTHGEPRPCPMGCKPGMGVSGNAPLTAAGVQDMAALARKLGVKPLIGTDGKKYYTRVRPIKSLKSPDYVRSGPAGVGETDEERIQEFYGFGKFLKD